MESEMITVFDQTWTSAYELGKSHGYDAAMWDIATTIQEIIPIIFRFTKENNRKAIPLENVGDKVIGAIKIALEELSKLETRKEEEKKEKASDAN